MDIILIQELLSLIIVMLGYPFIIIDLSRHKRSWPFFLAYSLLLISAAANLVRGSVGRGPFILLKHVLGIMVTGIIFACTAYLANKRIKRAKELGERVSLQ